MKIEIKNFINDLEKEVDEKFQKIELVTKKIAFDGFRKIAEETPIETGLSKSSWDVGINIEPVGIGKESSESEAIAIAIKNLKKLDNFKLGGIITYINNVEYLVFVEYGSPKIAATGMVETNIQILENKLNEALNEL